MRIGLDGKKHRRNLNIMVVGGSGSGKTRFYAKPNVMQANLTRIDNVLDGLTTKRDTVIAELDNTRVQLENAKAEMDAPFSREAELTEKTARLKELNILLNMDERTAPLWTPSRTSLAQEPGMRAVIRRFARRGLPY